VVDAVLVATLSDELEDVVGTTVSGAVVR